MDWIALTASSGILGAETRLALVTIEKNSAKVCEVKQRVKSPRCARARKARLLAC